MLPKRNKSRRLFPLPPGQGEGERKKWHLLRCGFSFLAFVAALIVLSLPARADISLRATVTPQRAQVGEPLTLSIEVSGARSVAAPAVKIDGFDVRYAGPMTQMSIINGTINSSVQHRYSLTPLREGHFTLGPFTVDYDGKTYRTAGVSVEVVGTGQPQGQSPQGQSPQGQAPSAGQTGTTQSAASGSRALRLELSVAQQEMYLHQRLPVDVTLYVGAARVADLQYPTLAADGLSLDKFTEPTKRQQVIDGESYQVLHFQTMVVPMRAGSLTLGPASMQMNVLSRRRSAFGDDAFFQHFGDSFAERRPVEVRSEPVTLNVLPLPEEGKPPGFSGAVGTFTLQVSASPADLTAGDPITVRMALSGTGNLAEANPPELSSTDVFRTYDTRAAKSAEAEPNGAAVARSYEQVLIPNDAAVKTIPPLRFSYFDPQARRYETLRSQPIALVVHPPRNAPRAEVFAGGAVPHAAPEERLGRDIVYIKDDPGGWSSRATPWYGRLTFLLWQPVPLALFGAAIWYDRRRQRLSGDVRYARFSRAGKHARRGLAVAEKALTGGGAAAFYDAVSRTMQEYLAAKLDLPPGAISADAVAQRGVPEDCVQRIAELFAICEQVRFAPSASNGDMPGALALGQDIVRRLERQRGLAPIMPRSMFQLIALVFSLALLAWPAHAGEPTAPSPQTTFYHANALYKDGQYAAAANEYEDLLQVGLASGNLYFNLGNAYFKAGERGKAILNYERARRFIPADPDLAANLSYAQSLTETEPCTPGLWQAVLFPLAHRFATSGLVWATSIVYTLLLFLLTTYRLWPSRPRWLLYAAAATGVLVLITSTSLLRRLLTDEWQRQGVVVRKGEAPTRFEPAENGTVHFVLREGALVRIAGTRENWIEVGRCDGRRGWIEKDAVAER
jgi:tetratricopeptide (TPR) repeat protein